MRCAESVKEPAWERYESEMLAHLAKFYPVDMRLLGTENAKAVTELGGSGQTGPLHTARFLAETTFGKAVTVTRILGDIGGGAHATHVTVEQGPDIHITVA